MNQTDGDASSLRKKVAALKQQAARMGLAGRGGRGRVGLRVQSRIAVMTYLQGRGSRGTSLDRRPKHLIVTGFDLADKEEVSALAPYYAPIYLSFYLGPGAFSDCW